MLGELFTDESINVIKRISIPLRPMPDQLVWIIDPKGSFTVKSALKTHQGHADSVLPGSLWSKFWKLKFHERFKVLLWRIGMDILPTKLNVAKRIGHGDTCCPLCNTKDESIIHVFFRCSVSKAIWFGQGSSSLPEFFPISSCLDIIKLIIDPPIPACDPLDRNNFCFRLPPRLLYLLIASGFSEIKLFIM